MKRESRAGSRGGGAEPASVRAARKPSWNVSALRRVCSFSRPAARLLPSFSPPRCVSAVVCLCVVVCLCDGPASGARSRPLSYPQGTTNDLSQYKLSREELEERRRARQHKPLETYCGPPIVVRLLYRGRLCEYFCNELQALACNVAEHMQ